MKKYIISKKTIILGKIEGSRKKRSPNIRWIRSTKKAIGMSLKEVGGAAEDRTLWTSLIHRVARSGSCSMAHDTITWQVTKETY